MGKDKQPSAADLKPGCEIFCGKTWGRGTLTCFAVDPFAPGKLYGITAGHVIKGDKVAIGSSASDLTIIPMTISGIEIKHAADKRIDCVSFEIDANIVKNLREGNFTPIGTQFAPSQVWDAANQRKLVEGATNASLSDKFKNETMNVKLIGCTQHQLTNGIVDKYSEDPKDSTKQKDAINPKGAINETSIAPGDSGGPVLSDSGLEYVGFVSMGGIASRCSAGEIVFLQDALEEMGLCLAKWDERSLWETSDNN